MIYPTQNSKINITKLYNFANQPVQHQLLFSYFGLI